MNKSNLLYFLVSSRWDDISLTAREIVRELFQNLIVSFRGRLVMT